MDWTQVEGNWKQMKGRVKERWGKLTDDDLTVIAGRRDQLEGMIQERYGYAKERARKEIDEWYHAMETDLAEQIETLRSGIQSLASTVERIAKMSPLTKLPIRQSRGTPHQCRPSPR